MLNCDHIAFVVRELEPALARLADAGASAGPIEEFPSEGTREVYLGAGSQSAHILLLQPLGDEGPYARALAKRGPGLHHLAFHVPDAHAFVAERPGWLLHPRSFETFERNKTLWLARPGVGALVEVYAGDASDAGAPLVERVELPVADPALAGLVTGLSGSTELAIGPGALTVAGRTLAFAALLRQDS